MQTRSYCIWQNLIMMWVISSFLWEHSIFWRSSFQKKQAVMLLVLLDGSAAEISTIFSNNNFKWRWLLEASEAQAFLFWARWVTLSCWCYWATLMNHQQRSLKPLAAALIGSQPKMPLSGKNTSFHQTPQSFVLQRTMLLGLHYNANDMMKVLFKYIDEVKWL